MTTFLAAYDLESLEVGLTAAEAVAAVHRRHDKPATFFVVGRLLEQDGPRYRDILDDPLFDIQTHTYSHRMLKTSGPHGPAVSLEEMEEEVSRGKQLVEDTFERECLGLRPGCGFHGGFGGMPERLEILWRNGIRFVSSDARALYDSIPNGLTQAYWYEADGYPDLLEIPAHGWHDNVLKGYSQNITLFPPLYPFAIPAEAPTTVDECFAHERLWLDQAIAEGLEFFSPCQHPWSLYRFDPEIGTVDRMLAYLEEMEIPVATYADFYGKWASKS